MMKKILLADDVKFFVELEKTFLKRTDCEILTAYNGREALELIRSEKPDLVLMDLYMPELNGDECCMAVKEDPSTRNIPVIMVTMAGKEEDKSKCLLAGCDDYITKPINRMTLLEKVTSYLKIPVRRYLRVPIDAEATFAVKDKQHSGRLVEIGEGGAFLESDSSCSIGTAMELIFKMPDSDRKLIKVDGEVVRLLEEREARTRRVRQGMGIEFTFITAEAKQRIAAYVAMGNYLV